MSSLIKRYQAELQNVGRVNDSVQHTAIEKLALLSDKLIDDRNEPISTWSRIASLLLRHHTEPVIGLYLWGGVGRGKTWLMNLFYEELDITEKNRIHFHHFMLSIHEKLGDLKQQKNPLQIIARQLSEKYRVLCIDEFIVTNITDAMILSELLHALFKHRMCLVVTSNRIPDDLYLNGLQRERFLPAIDQINTHTEVFHLDGGIDHRTSLLEHADIYYCPISDDTNRLLDRQMNDLAITPVIENRTLQILNRDIATIKCSDEVAWFDFKAICSAPRAAQDYIELAHQFTTIFISDIPVMGESTDDKARRFIYLIDELYDRNVKLIVSAMAHPEDLYRGNMLKFAFQRTSSRLIEMRSHHYLSQPHRVF